MKSSFPGFPSEALQFLRGIARNNNRDWLQARKPVFEEKVRVPVLNLVDAVNEAMKRVAPDYVSDPKKAIYRFYRDTRFSKDKKPYKEHGAASFRHRFLEGEG